jgi:hypothetical protein
MFSDKKKKRTDASSSGAPSGAGSRIIPPADVAAAPIETAEAPTPSGALDPSTKEDKQVLPLDDLQKQLFDAAKVDLGAEIESIFQGMEEEFAKATENVLHQIVEHAVSTLDDQAGADSSAGYRTFVGQTPVVVRYATLTTEDHDTVLAAITRLVEEEVARLKKLDDKTTDYALQRITMHYVNPKTEPVALVMPHDTLNTIAIGGERRRIAALLHAGEKASIPIFDAETYAEGVHLVKAGETCATTPAMLAVKLKKFFEETDFASEFAPEQPWPESTLLSVHSAFLPALLKYANALIEALESKKAECEKADEVLRAEVFGGLSDIDCGGFVVNVGNISVVKLLRAWLATHAFTLAAATRTSFHYVFELGSPVLDLALATLGIPPLSFVYKNYIIPGCCRHIQEKAKAEIEEVMQQHAQTRIVKKLDATDLAGKLGNVRAETLEGSTNASGRLYPQMPVTVDYSTGAGARPTASYVTYDVQFTPLAAV